LRRHARIATMIAAPLAVVSDMVRAYFAGREEVSAVYLFGSVARGRAHRHSDVDVAVLLREDVLRLSPSELAAYRMARIGELMDALHTDAVDLIVLNTASALVAFEAIHRGRLVLSRDQSIRVKLELDIRHRYLDMLPLLALKARYLKERLDRGEFGKARHG